MEKIKNKKEQKKEEITSCNDKLCPIHGTDKLKARGRTFQGRVIKKTHKKITIEFERMLKIPKFERYEKRKTKIHSRLPDCMKSTINVGDLVEVGETRPVSKMIHSVVLNKIKGADEK